MNQFAVNATRSIGGNAPVFIIAEAGINHNGNVEIAKKMIDTAAKCGADAIKFQTFKAEEFIADPKETYTYYSQGEKVTESMLEMFKRNEFSREDWKEIVEHCNKAGILFFTTPQNLSDLEFMQEITELPLIKVGADDLTNLPLLKSYARKGIPMIISAGMAYLSEIEDAVAGIKGSGNPHLAVLYCVSSYPAAPEEVGMHKMKTIADAFDVVTGFSDHTIGNEAAILATAFGAKIIEKHFTLDKSFAGPDHWFSSDPAELEQLIASIRKTELMMKGNIVAPSDNELMTRKACRRSIVASSLIREGEVITEEKITFKRPGTGLPPKMQEYVVGRRAKKDIHAGELILFDML